MLLLTMAVAHPTNTNMNFKDKNKNNKPAEIAVEKIKWDIPYSNLFFYMNKGPNVCK